MQHIENFDSYLRLNEEENKSYSPLSSYKAVALGVSRAFNLLSYFYAIAKIDADPVAWKATMKGIAAKKDYDDKWNTLIDTAKKIQSQIENYSKKRRSEDVNVGRFFDAGVVSQPIPLAIEKFKTASDYLIKDLSENGIKERLLLLDRGLPLEPYKISESLLFEGSSKKRTPTEAEVLNLASLLNNSVVEILSRAREMKQMFPESRAFYEGVISKYVTPASNKIKEILGSPVPDSSLELSKSVRKSYEDKGWVLKTTQDKHLIDQYEDLIDLKDQISIAREKMSQAKQNVIKELAPESDAGEFIDAGNRILDSVESKIQEKEKVEDLRRRAGLMIPIGKDQEIPTSSTTQPTKVTGSGYVNPDELRKLLQKRVSR